MERQAEQTQPARPSHSCLTVFLGSQHRYLLSLSLHEPLGDLSEVISGEQRRSGLCEAKGAEYSSHSLSA